MAFLAYDDVATHYASTRRPAGLGLVLEALGRDRPLSGQRLLDAGCGSGHYLAELAGDARRCCGLDPSRGMLREAERHLGRGAQVDLTQGDLLALPFQGACFDGAVCTFVLHHLAPAERSQPATSLALSELARVLTPGARLVIQTASQAQIRDGYWWAALIPEAIARASACYLELDPLQRALEQAGFTAVERHVDLDSLLQGPDYLTPEGPLQASYRAGDSAWSLATPEELARAQDRTRGLLEAGEMERFLAEREAVRRATGQCTFVVARRS